MEAPVGGSDGWRARVWWDGGGAGFVRACRQRQCGAITKPG